ncbi:MAG: LPS assembly lipoprotein LptE [Nitratireductor sp.]
MSISNFKRFAALTTLCLTASLTFSACQPLYSTDGQTLSSSSAALSSVSVAPVKTRQGQQVRNHLIFLLNGGAYSGQSAYELTLRVNSSQKRLASRLDATGKTAGQVTTTVSYELYDNAKNEITHHGTRSATATFDQTSQSFANERAVIDAENRSAKAVAERIRLAIASDLSAN